MLHFNRTVRDVLPKLFRSGESVNYFNNELALTKSGKLNTWDYRWTYAVWKHDGLCVSPNVNLVRNIGFAADATHTKNPDSEKQNAGRRGMNGPDEEFLMNELDLNKKIYVAGHKGLVGSAFCRKLKALGATNIIIRTHAELNLCDQAATNAFFHEERPDYVIMAAAKVGGIVANDTYSADFMRENLQIQTNMIDSAYRSGCKKLLFLGSSCVYPKLCPQPIKEEYLLSGPLEPTNDGYAVAKISGLMLCKTYRKQYGFNAVSVMPGNLYGPGDNFHPDNSHVLPALMRRFHEAKQAGLSEVTVWGTGKPLREFIHVDDMVDASLFLMRRYSGEKHVNIGSGVEMTMMELAELLAKVVGFSGNILTDPSKPDGTPRKFMDSSFLFGMGWKPSIAFEDGLRRTYQWYLEQKTCGGIRNGHLIGGEFTCSVRDIGRPYDHRDV